MSVSLTFMTVTLLSMPMAMISMISMITMIIMAVVLLNCSIRIMPIDKLSLAFVVRLVETAVEALIYIELLLIQITY